MPRSEDARLMTGAGQFSDDFSYPGQAYAAMVRSPHPHARIVRIDKTAALAMPGVLGVYTGGRFARPTGSKRFSTIRCRRRAMT